MPAKRKSSNDIARNPNQGKDEAKNSTFGQVNRTPSSYDLDKTYVAQQNAPMVPKDAKSKKDERMARKKEKKLKRSTGSESPENAGAEEGAFSELPHGDMERDGGVQLEVRTEEPDPVEGGEEPNEGMQKDEEDMPSQEPTFREGGEGNEKNGASDGGETGKHHDNGDEEEEKSSPPTWAVTTLDQPPTIDQTNERVIGHLTLPSSYRPANRAENVAFQVQGYWKPVETSGAHVLINVTEAHEIREPQKSSMTPVETMRDIGTLANELHNTLKGVLQLVGLMRQLPQLQETAQVTSGSAAVPGRGTDELRDMLREYTRRRRGAESEQGGQGPGGGGNNVSVIASSAETGGLANKGENRRVISHEKTKTESEWEREAEVVGKDGLGNEKGRADAEAPETPLKKQAPPEKKWTPPKIIHY